MIERLIYTALSQGIADVLRTPELLERYFAEQSLFSPAEVTAIKEIFIAKPPQVTHAYPRQDSKFPLYSIVLMGESESDKFLGEDVGDIIDGRDDDDGAEVKGSIWEHNHSIFVVTEHPDVTLYMYELAKLFIFRAHAFFIDNGILTASFSGNDLAPDPRYIPAHLFVRQFNTTLKRERDYIGAVIPRAFKIGGVFVDDSSTTAPATAVGVRARVRVGQED